MEFIVGSFNVPALYVLQFDPDEKKLFVKDISPAIGGHSWLAFSANRQILYCTAWTQPKPSIAAYKINSSAPRLEYINSKTVSSRPGYVCCSDKYIYTVGGATGEVFSLCEDGSIGDLVQRLQFEETNGHNMSVERGQVAHGDFGGLRHGAHSCDLSPDKRTLYVADIGRNCIWVVDTEALRPSQNTSNSVHEAVASDSQLHVRQLQRKQVAPRQNDGPRHAWPHPNGRVVYCIQEHSNMVDVFVLENGAEGKVERLRHDGGASVLPPGEDCAEYWADEVRLASGPDPLHPGFLFASTRGLSSETKGFVSVFALHKDGSLASKEPIDMWMTPTSGGIANAIEPAPWLKKSGSSANIHYLSLTDSEVGLVMILSFDGCRIREVCRVSLPLSDEKSHNVAEVKDGIAQAATAIWLL